MEDSTIKFGKETFVGKFEGDYDIVGKYEERCAVNRMDDLISRQAAIDAMCCACGYDCDKSKFVYNAPQEEMVIMCPEHYALSTLPPAQPEIKKGKWIRTRTLTHDGELYCNQCEQEHPEQKIIWNFCPNCGCRMEEGDSE